MIILVASASVMISYFVVNAIPFFSSDKQEVKVKVAEPITDTVTPPDASVFNSDAINPTVEVIIGGNSSQQPETPVLPDTSDGTQ